MAAAASIFPEDATPPVELQRLAKAIASDGGVPMAIYQEPLGKHWQVFALLPIAKVTPTPYQRDLSQAHLKRLREVVKQLDRFIDPITAVRAWGDYWTPNGNHRRAAASRLGAKLIPAIVIPEAEVAFQILALNTEKAPNLKDKSLEVVRMYRALVTEQPRRTEKQFAFEFEKPHFATLGIIYEKKPRFSGGAYAPILNRVDKFFNETLKAVLKQREERAAELEEVDDLVNQLVAKGRKRGLVHPFLKNFIIARVNPLTRARKNLPSYERTISSLRKAIEEFDLGKIHFGQVAGAAAAVAAASAGS